MGTQDVVGDEQHKPGRVELGPVVLVFDSGKLGDDDALFLTVGGVRGEVVDLVLLGDQVF